MNKASTMNDVAKEAGVSQATVSYVINNSASISLEVRERVNSAIKKLGYVTNSSAKSLKTQQTNTVGVILPDIDGGIYSEFIREFELNLRRNGFIMFLCNTSYDPDLERQYVIKLIEQNVAGIIILYSLIDKDIYTEIKKHNIRTVAMDDSVEQENIVYPSIEFDFNKAGKIAVSHLLQTGARKICFASEPLFNKSLRDRYEGFCNVIKDNRLSDDRWCTIIEERQYKKLEMGYNIGAKIILNNKVDAVFATSDILAFGIVQKLLEYGKRIPQDIVIVGFDDIPLASYMTPKLSTISQPIHDSAHMAVRALFSDSAVKKLEIPHKPLEPLLIIRESTLHHFDY